MQAMELECASTSEGMPRIDGKHQKLDEAKKDSPPRTIKKRKALSDT